MAFGKMRSTWQRYAGIIWVLTFAVQHIIPQAAPARVPVIHGSVPCLNLCRISPHEILHALQGDDGGGDFAEQHVDAEEETRVLCNL